MPITTYHPDAATYLAEWAQVRAVVAGPRTLKAGGETYLPRCPGHGTVIAANGKSIDEYQSYVQRACPLPYAGPLVSRLLGLVFRQPPVITLPASVQPHMINLPLLAPAQSIEHFAKAVLRENLVMGRGGIMVDWDDAAGRPYQRLYAAESIVSWDYTLVGAIPVTSYLVLREIVTERDARDPWIMRYVTQYTEWTLDAPVADDIGVRAPGRYPIGALRVRRYRDVLGANGKPTGEYAVVETRQPQRRSEPLWFIPFVPFSPFTLALSPIERPPFADLSDLIVAHYRNSSDYENLLHQCGAGSVLFGAGFTRTEQNEPIQVGPGRVVITENPSASLAYVQTQGQSGAELTTAMEAKKVEMGVAAGRLLLSQQKNVAESGASLELQFAGEDATLQQIAGTTAMALEEALRLHVWWDGTADTPMDVEGVRIELNDQYAVSRLAPSDVVQLVTAGEMGGLTEKDLYWNLLTGQRLDPNTTYEEWLAMRRTTPAPATDTGDTEDEPEPEDEEPEDDGD